MEPLKNFMIRLANDFNQPDNQNQTGATLAWTLCNYYDSIDFNNRDKLYESLLKFYPQNEQKVDWSILPSVQNKPEEVASEGEIKDFRIKSVEVANLRGIPASEDNKKYGISFCENDKPKSAVILGANGAGKSSIYDGMEYCYSQTVGEAKMRTSNENPKAEWFKDFLGYWGNDPICEVKTVDGEYSLNQHPISDNVNQNRQFISEHDIIKYGKIEWESKENDDESFHYLLASSLGFDELLDFKNTLSTFAGWNRRKEWNELLDNEKKLKEEKSTFINNEKALEEKRSILIGLDLLGLSNEYYQDLENKTAIIYKIKNTIQSFDFDIGATIKKVREFIEKNEALRLFDISIHDSSKADFLSTGLKLMDQEITKQCPFCENSNTNYDDLKKQVAVKLNITKQYIGLKNHVNKLNEEISNFDLTLHTLFLTIYNQLTNENNSLSSVGFLSEIQNINQLILDKINKLDNNQKFLFQQKASDFSDPSKVFGEYSLFLENEINDFISFLKSTYLSDRRMYIDLEENKLNELIKQDNPLKQKAVLEGEIGKLENELVIRKSRLENLDNENLSIKAKRQLFSKLQSEAGVLVSKINSILGEDIKESVEKILDILNKILKDYFDGGDDFLIRQIMKPYPDTGNSMMFVAPSIDEKTGKQSEGMAVHYEREGVIPIYQAFITSDEGKELTPGKYFNTFRYKLFCMMLKISIALINRQSTKVNLPFVFDDVFYASDFHNRVVIENFMKKLYKIIDNYNPKDMPVQLIIFTHDDQIFQSILESANRNNKADETIFAKLLKHDQAEDKGCYKELTYRFKNMTPRYKVEELANGDIV